MAHGAQIFLKNGPLARYNFSVWLSAVSQSVLKYVGIPLSKNKEKEGEGA